MRNTTSRSYWRYACFIAGLTTTGCPGSIEDLELFTNPPDCNVITQRTFKRSCATASCHDAASAAQELDLETDGIGSRLVGVQATKAGCEGELAIPADPAQSILYRKLLQPPPCGQRMPSFTRALSQREMDCMLEWIAEQAPTP